jgi:tetratricopeptide (TPR) repeat protein
VKAIAEELGVSTLLTGSVRKFGDRLKISVQLIRGHDEMHLWQQVYERNISDVFEVQSDVSQQIANALQAKISPEVKLRIEAIPTASQQAYDYFLKGRDEYFKGWWLELGDKHANLAIEFFDKAIALDSNFSNAYAGKGEAYWYLAHYSPNYTTDFWRKSKENLDKALELDPQNGWAYSELAVVQHNWDWDRKGALRSLKKAVELNPGDFGIHNDFFWYHLKTGNCDSMQVELNKLRAIEDGEYVGHRIMMAICQQDIAQLTSLNTDDNVSGAEIWAAIERMLILKEFDQALSLIEKKRTSIGEQWYLFWKGELFALWGKKEEALDVVEKLKVMSRTEHIWISQLAVIYMGLGDEEMAYKYLEDAVRERDLMLHTVAYTAAFYSHRNDPRFISLLKRTWIN